MKVVHVIRHSCIRVHKLAWAQRQGGAVTPYLLNAVPSETHGMSQYELAFRFGAEMHQTKASEFVETVRRIQALIKPDIWHCHNEPNWPVALVREAIGDEAKVIWDVHDLRSYMKGEEATPDEDLAAKAAHHIFTVSLNFEEELQRRYPDAEVSHYCSMVPRDWFPDASPTVNCAMVYQGGFQPGTMTYRDYTDYFKKCAVPVDVFPAFDVGAGALFPNNLRVYRPQGVPQLYNTLARYEAGFVGAPFVTPGFTGALPNKLWEYIASGIPIVVANSPAIDEFLQEVPVGISVKEPFEVPKALSDLRDMNLRENVAEVRDHFSMDQQNSEYVEPVYRELLK